MSMRMTSPRRHLGEDFWPPEYYMIPQLSYLNNPVALEPGDEVWREVDWDLLPGDSIQPQSIVIGTTGGTSVHPNSKKRAYDELEHEQSSDEDALPRLSDESGDLEKFLNLKPSQPFINFLDGAVKVSNPFEDVAACRHRILRPALKVKGVNSYVKFRLADKNAPNGTQINDKALTKPMTYSNQPFRRITNRNAQSSTQTEIKTLANPITYRNKPFRSQHGGPGRTYASIPLALGSLGRSFRFDATETKLFKFYQTAMCSGRTLLPGTNGWLKDLAPMVESDDMMAHAVLAFAAGYVLDLRPSEELRQRANYYYKKASQLLTATLNSNRFVEERKEDAVVGCIRILWCDDIVQWEMRRTKDQIPRWWLGVLLGTKIMAITDQSFRYYGSLTNVQCTTARISNGNNMAMVHLIGRMTLPLSVRDTEGANLHPWLLEGTEPDSRRIFGGTGMCPKLLHMIGQITYLSARMHENDVSIIFPLAANKTADRLINFRQWSELSHGPLSTEHLLENCCLKNGLVDTAREVTELSGEAWVQTARVYLQIRFFRLPRNHPHVQHPFRLLCRIIEKLPYSGPLFTAQTPFFPVFLLGLVATKPEDRQIARNWFETVVSNSGARSNVPPIWNVLQETWKWIDRELIEDDIEDVDEKPICDRLAWWELLVDRWYAGDGYFLSIV